MKIQNRWITFLFLPVFVFALADFARSQDKTVTYFQDAAALPPDLVVTLRHLKADIRFKPEDNMVMAKTEFIFYPNRYRTDSVSFYAPEFKVKSAVIEESTLPDGGSQMTGVNGKNSPKDVKQHLSGNNLVFDVQGLNLQKGKEYKLILEYTVQPKAGMIYFIGWKPEEDGKRKEIWAHRPNGWLPYIDARITMDMYYTIDKDYKVFANGDRDETKDNPDNTRTWHYRMEKDHPYFSTAVVIGDYDFKMSKSGRGVPLEFWYYSGQEKKVATTYQYTENMMDFLEKELGVVYPYPVYRQAPVIDYMYGAMDTTTSTVFGDFMLIDRGAYWQRNYINTNAHEMAHQWFGNCISHLVNKDVWLTESFATYYAKMFERSIFGESYYQNAKNDELIQALTAAKTNNYPVCSSMGGVPRIYQKGSLVLGMLRYVMGDQEFRDAIKHYVEKYRFSYAQSADFFRCVYDVTGISYNWFFDEWILRGGEPNYRVSYSVADDTLGNRNTWISVTQTQDVNDLSGLFRMPVKIEVHYKDGTYDSTVTVIENKFHEVKISDAGKRPIAFVLFDPGREILKKVTFDRTFEELKAQASGARNMIDRYDAIAALRSFPYNERKDLLVRCYSHENFHLVKSEIIDQLSSGKTDDVLDVFRQALNDADANVRKAALKSVFPVPFSLKTDFEKALADTSFLNVELSLQALCQSFPDNAETYLNKTKDQMGWRGMNIHIKWLELQVSRGKKEYLKEIIEKTSPTFEFETRINALNTLKRLLYYDDETVKNATSASKHWNNKLATAGRDYLTYFGK